MSGVGAHWATDLIGKPWTPDGQGPGAYSCWGLFRESMRRRHGVELDPLPGLAAGTPGLAAAMHAAARTSGWSPVDDSTPAEGDAVICRSGAMHHIGYVCRANGALGVLHSVGDLLEDGQPHGTVIWQPWQQFRAGVWRNVTLWRRKP